MHELIIIGAGPAGLSAGLRAKELDLNYLILERGEVAQTFLDTYQIGKEVTDFPRELKKKGNFWFERCSVEDLIIQWKRTSKGLNVKTNQEVLEIKKKNNNFLIQTQKNNYESEIVIIAIGKQEKLRKLGVKGENLKKVFYRLKNTNDFDKKNILVVGGGDSAVDAALTLSKKNKVIISYRKDSFFRLNEENSEEINNKITKNGIEVFFKSNVMEIKEDKVILDVDGQKKEIKNDFVFIFAGSELPSDFFKKINLKIENNKVVLDENFQSSIENLYIIGDAASKPPFLIKPAINHGFDVVGVVAGKLK